MVVGNLVPVCGSDRDWGAPSTTTSSSVGGWYPHWYVLCGAAVFQQPVKSL